MIRASGFNLDIIDFFQMSKHLGKEVIKPIEGYAYDTFYEVVKKNNVKVVDLYSVNGKTVIPAGSLFEYE